MFTRKNIYIALFLIILLGAFLRFYKLGNNSFVADEFLDINSTYAYAKTGVWQNWDFNFGKVNNENIFEARDERASVYKWFPAMFFNFLPPTEGVARSASALWGILSIILVYFAATFFTKKKTIGLLSAFLFAISISGLEFDRRFRMYAMFLPVYLAFSWLVFCFLERKYVGKITFLKNFNQKWGLNLLFLIPAVLLGILSFLTHQLTANIAFTIGIYLLFWMVVSFKKEKTYQNKYFILFFAGILGFVGLNFLVPKEIESFTAGLTFFNDHWSYIGIVLADYSNGLLGIIFILLGAYYIYKKQNMPKEALWLLVSFLIPLLAAILLWHRNVGTQYVFFIKSFEIILIAAGIYFVAQFLRDNLKNYGKKAYLAILILAILILPNYAYFFQENNTYKQTSSADNPNYRKRFTYFKKYKKDGDVLITRNFRNYYWSGSKVKVFDFGGELSKEKLSLNQVQQISTENASGWFIISGNDESYIANDAISYIERNFEKVSNPQVRGDVMVYRWGN